MKKILILSLITCMLLSGCRVGISMSDKNTDKESSVGIFNVHTSYFDRYSINKDEDSCEAKGRLHQAADDDNCIITYLTAEGGDGIVNITGNMDCSRGNLRLVYTAPDGTETLIADGSTKAIDVRVDVTEGEGSIGFAGDGESAVCDFRIKMAADGGVTFAGIMENDSVEDIEDVEIPEIREEPEKPEKPERSEGTEKSKGMDENMENIETDMDDIGEDIEAGGLDQIEDNWPESIRYDGDGVYADPMSVQFQVDAPMTLSLSCVTRRGELRLKIVNNDTLKETYFDEMNPNGQYTVDIDKKGTYTMLFYAKWHVGSVEMSPGND